MRYIQHSKVAKSTFQSLLWNDLRNKCEHSSITSICFVGGMTYQLNSPNTGLNLTFKMQKIMRQIIINPNANIIFV